MLYKKFNQTHFVLLLLALINGAQTYCSAQNTKTIPQIAQSCSSKYFNTQHENRIPALHGIPTLHEIAFTKLKSIITDAITDLIDNKYDDDNDKQKKLNFVEMIAAHSPHVFEKFINTSIDTRISSSFLHIASKSSLFLHIASNANNPEMILLLLNAGANVNQQDISRWAPLYYAAYSNADKAIPLLLNAGADVNQQNIYGWAPLNLAACNNADKAIPLLIAAGADVNQQDNISLDTPLHTAAYSNADKAIPLLINAGADITIKDKHGHTARNQIKSPATLEIFDQAVATRLLQQKSATKIQALGRGFIARKNI